MSKLVNVIEVAAVAVVVEAVADDELVGDAEADVVDGEVRFVGVGLHGHGGDAHVFRAGLGQHVVQVDVGVAGIDDVLEDEDPFPANVLVEADEAVDAAG